LQFPLPNLAELAKNNLFFYYVRGCNALTKMVKYSCKRYGKEFSQKSHYDSHNRRKTPCENNADKIKALVDKN
jgi:hypothetical protein